MERHNDVNTPLIALVGIVGAILTFALIVGLQALYFSYAQREIDRKVTAAPALESDSLVAEQEIKLTRYGWLNREQQQAAIPIERAMKLVADEVELTANQERTDER
jgi:hypothetical protein